MAEHLGVTEQAAAQLIAQLIMLGYVTRQPDASDARAQLLMLTERGWACTEAAEAAAGETVDQWRSELDAPLRPIRRRSETRHPTRKAATIVVMNAEVWR